MNKVTSYDEILSAISEVKKLKIKFITNFFHDKQSTDSWITAGELYMDKIANTLMLFRNRKDFYNLFFCTSSIEDLEKAKWYIEREIKKRND